MSLTEDLKKELESEYFLIGKKTIIGGALVTALAILGISWASAKLALESVAGKASLDLVREAASKAERVLEADEALERLNIEYERLSNKLILINNEIENKAPKQELEQFVRKGNSASATIGIKEGDNRVCEKGAFVSGITLIPEGSQAQFGKMNVTCSPLR